MYTAPELLKRVSLVRIQSRALTPPGQFGKPRCRAGSMSSTRLSAVEAVGALRGGLRGAGALRR